ncbi:HAD hydrolase subfamily IA REG-2-like protein [Cristinia sonorae]|uniref:HAD hydrolase subfamily IA REG-2-like protein n=1 Tax=Cristinia sonorae TaxID=1940300 RepID=A0A8K0XK43_9AGAR|nr:HAD hydrolase subfamily IA REG-2-like protein [Cristinia sonorae]
MVIRLVTFDALHTIITPRLPIFIQYSQTFEPYLGVLGQDALKSSFKLALKQLQAEKPVYGDGARRWWGEVIRRTALGAGADPEAVERNIGEIVPRLLHRFSSKEGYKLYDDTYTCLEQLKTMNIRTGLISNTDVRIRGVLDDLTITSFLNPILLSEEEGVEKPSREIFQRACDFTGVQAEEAVHVGDDLEADYFGAMNSGLRSLLIRRPGPEGEGEAKEVGENLAGLRMVEGLQQVVDWVRRENGII